MSHITASKRRSLPKSSFGLPGERKYPTDTVGRAKAAKVYASKEYHRGKLSASQKARIDKKANRRLKRGKRR